MTAQELKNSILQLAVQGKLVPQDSSDEPASELLKRIQAEKARLIKEGKIKKEKALPPIAEEELPFDIPESWEWLKLGQLCQLGEGEKIRDKKYPYLEAKYLRGKIEATILTSGEFVKKGTRLILVDGENSGEVFLATEDGYKGSTFKVLYIPEEMYIPYMLMFILLNKQLLRNRKTGSAIPHLNKELFFNLLIPIPPFAEQQRIVDKIEEFLPLIEEYGKAETRMKELNVDFPDMLRKSILQQAVQGRLTERNAEDEPASELLKRIQAEKARLIKEGKIKKEKPLPPIMEEEIPFDIPDTWEWVRLGQLYSFCNGTASRGTSNGIEKPVLRLADLSNNTINIKNIRNLKLSEAEFSSHQLRKDDMVFIRVNGSKERVATAFHYTEQATISYCDHLFCGNKCSSLINSQYTMIAFNSPNARKQLSPEIKTSAGQNTISQGSMAKILLPLPPLEEQKRIVARVEELLALCDKLKK